MTYGDFRLGHKGSTQTGRIFDSVTHDAGRTWSAPTLISGSLDQAFVSIPVFSGGTVYVAFLNTTDLTTGRDDYEVVRVSPATGAALGQPVKVATVIDGATDYPIALGRQTYQDSIFRSWAAGNITADPDQPPAPGRRLVGHAQQRDTRPGRPLRRQDQLRRGRQPIHERRHELVPGNGDRAARRPVPALGRLRQQWQAAGRHV